MIRTYARTENRASRIKKAYDVAMTLLTSLSNKTLTTILIIKDN